MNKWTPIKDYKGKTAGYARRLSGPFDPEEWEVRDLDGCEVVFFDWFEAVKWLLEQESNMLYQVKTALTHQYWTGRGWSMKRNEGRKYAREAHAESVADRFEGRGWDKVVAVSWVPDNWCA